MLPMLSGKLSPWTSIVWTCGSLNRHWDEDKVADWLKRINCAQYVELFKRESQ